MKRSDLEHILRASKDVTSEVEFIVIGSQAILGRFPDAPRVLRESMEADLYPRRRPELSDAIEGSLGRYSQFNQTFGYFADGVSPVTATLPKGWEERLVRLSNENTGGAIGWCLDPHDLAFFKMIRPSQLQRLIEAVEDGELRARLSEAFTLCRQASSH
jgi:hypothetical protein